jgi:hypothetical protein
LHYEFLVDLTIIFPFSPLPFSFQFVFSEWVLFGCTGYVDGAQHSGLQNFWTSSIVRYSEEYNFSKTVSVSVLKLAMGLCWVRWKRLISIPQSLDWVIGISSF